MTPESDSVTVLTASEFDQAIATALQNAGCSLEELQTQAAAGIFDSELARRTWFAIAAFID